MKAPRFRRRQLPWLLGGLLALLLTALLALLAAGVPAVSGAGVGSAVVGSAGVGSAVSASAVVAAPAGSAQRRERDALAGPPGENRIQVDLRVANIYGFSTRDKSYIVEGKYWLTFPAELADQLRASGSNPGEMIALYNNIRPWDSRVTPLRSQPEKQADGRYRIGYEFNGTFYSNTIDYSLSPFGTLPLAVILKPQLGRLQSGSGSPDWRMVPGVVEVGSRVNIDGYELKSRAFVSVPKTTPSRLDTDAGTNPDRLELRLVYSVDFWAALVKWLLPLIISMIVILVTPRIASSMKTERLAIPPVVLLTIVLMQQSYRDSLPTLPYLTFLDGLYAYSYLVTLAIFLSFIWGANLVEAADDSSRARVVRRVDLIDHWLQRLALSGYGVLTVAWILAARI